MKHLSSRAEDSNLNDPGGGFLSIWKNRGKKEQERLVKSLK